MNLDDVIDSRFSCRKFTANTIEHALVENLIEAASKAPNSCNLQLYSFIHVDQPDILAGFSKHVTGKVKWTRNLLVAVVDPDISFENQANYISLGMAIENLLLKATSMGLATIPIAGFVGKDYIKSKLDIPARLDVPLLIFLGEPAELQGNPYKLSVERLLSHNKYKLSSPFSLTSYHSGWTPEQALDYRRRISGVYFPRSRQGVWKLNQKLCQDLLDDGLSIDGNVSVYFPWEPIWADLSEQHKDRVIMHDDNQDYLDYLSNKDFEINLVKNKKNIVSSVAILTEANIFLVDLGRQLRNINLNLKMGGELKIVSIRKYGAIGLVFGLLRCMGFKRHIYHKSSFYKIGPYEFRSTYRWKHELLNQGFQVNSITKVNQGLLIDKVPKKLRFFTSLFSSIFNDTEVISCTKIV